MNFKVSQLKSLTSGEVAVDDLIYVIDSNPTDGSVKSKKVTVGDLIDSRIYGISSSQFVLITGYYADPSWISSLDWSKITNAPSFVTSLSALTDVQLSTPLSGQALVYNGTKWVNQGIGELDTLATVTTRGNTTTNSISTGNITASASNIASLTLVDTLQPYAWSFRNNGTNLLFVNNGGTNIVKLTAGGNVLVGTNTDSGFKLDVNGDTRVSGSMTVNNRYLYHQGNSAIQYFMTSNAWSGTNSIFFGDDSSNTIGAIIYNHQFDSLAFTVNGTNALHINSSRNIGIGTTSPTNAVHIRTAAGGATSNYALVWQESTGDRVLGYLGADNSAFFSGALYLYQNGVSNTKITANGTSYLMGGNVLVGTTTDAGYKLDVNGSTRVKSAGMSASTNALLVQNSASTTMLQLRDDNVQIFGNWLTFESQRYIYKSQNATSILTLTNDSTVSSFINLYGSSHATLANVLDFGTASTNRLRITGATGNVLIGTTTDAGYKFDVNGTARFSNDIRVSTSSGATIFLGVDVNNTVRVTDTYAKFQIQRTGAGGLISINGGSQAGTSYNLGDTGHEFTLSNNNTTADTFTITRPFFGNVVATTKTIINITTTNASTLSNATLLRGIYFNPTVTDWASIRAIETTAGDVIFNGGNVGIGKTNPTYKLEVFGGIRSAFVTTTTVHGEGNTLLLLSGLNGTNPGVNEARLHLGYNQNDPAVRLNSNGVSVNTGTWVFLPQTWFAGGITSSHNIALTIDGMSNGVTNSVASEIIRFTQRNGQFANFYDAGAGLSEFRIWQQANSSNYIYLKPGQTSYFSSGNLVIGGTTDAGYKLDVNGTIRTTGTSTNGLILYEGTYGAKVSMSSYIFTIEREGTYGITTYLFKYSDGTAALSLTGNTTILGIGGGDDAVMLSRNVYARHDAAFGFTTYASTTKYKAIQALFTDNSTSGVAFNYKTGGTDTEAMRITSAGNIVVSKTVKSIYDNYSDLGASAERFANLYALTGRFTNVSTNNLGPNGAATWITISSSQFALVGGQLNVQGLGSTSATTALSIQNSSSTTTFSVRDDGLVIIPGNTYLQGFTQIGAVQFYPVLDGGYTTSSTGKALRVDTSFNNTVSSTYAYQFGAFSLETGTASNINGTSILTTLAPTSGSKTFTTLNVGSTINATGTYSGIVRGILYHPILTSTTGVTHRAIETTSGDVIFNGGKVGIGTSSPTGRNGYGGGTLVELVDNAAYASFNLNGGNVSSPTYFTLGAQGAGADIRVNNKPLRIAVNSVDVLTIPTTGNVLINTTTDAGYKLDVNGSARVGSLGLYGNNGTITAPLIKFNGSNKVNVDPQGYGTVTNDSLITGNYILASGGGIRANGGFGAKGGNSVISTPFISYGISRPDNDASISALAGMGGVHDGATFWFQGLGLVFYTSNGPDISGGSYLTEKMRLSSVGNLGIGTTSPSYKTQISQAGGSSTAISTIASTNCNLVVQNTTDLAGTYAGIGFMNPYDTQGYIGVAQVGTGYGAGGNMLFALRPAGGGTVMTEYMRLTSGGNLLLGTTTDSARLTVKGSGSTSATTSFLVQNSSNNNQYQITDDGTHYLSSNGNIRLTIANSLSTFNQGVLFLNQVDFSQSNRFQIDYDSVNDIGRFRANNGGMANGMTMTSLGPIRVGIGQGINQANASSVLELQSTTLGFLAPRMTTAQINAITTPAEGLQVYNTDLHVICFYDGTAWKKVSHSNM